MIKNFLGKWLDHLISFMEGKYDPDLSNTPVAIALPTALINFALRGMVTGVFMITAFVYFIGTPFWLPVLMYFDDNTYGWLWVPLIIYCMPAWLFVADWLNEKWIEWYRKTYYDA